jgi:hypothetical protein
MAADTVLPTAEQEQRAKWNLLLRDLELRAELLQQARLDIEQRIEDLRLVPETERLRRLDIEQRIEALRLVSETERLRRVDIEQRIEQVRQLKTYEGWRLAFSGMTAGAVLLGVGIAIGHWVLG